MYHDVKVFIVSSYYLIDFIFNAVLIFFLPQTFSRALCILRHSPTPQISVCSMLGLLARYAAGIRYALELQVLQKGASEACQAEDDDTNQSVSSIEEDFVTAFEHLEEEDTGDYSWFLLDSLRITSCLNMDLNKPFFLYTTIVNKCWGQWDVFERILANGHKDRMYLIRKRVKL